MSGVAWLFVLGVALGLPAMAWRSSRTVRGAAALPRRSRIYASSSLLEAALLLGAWVTARQQGIQLFPVPDLHAGDILVGVAWVGIKVLRLSMVLRRPEGLSRRRMAGHLAPRTPGEAAGYVGMAALAAVAEEAAYRGVLFQLAAHATGSFWIAGIAGALSFGLAHLTQGRRSAAAAGLLGFGNQVVVLLTGSLWVAIAAHFAYDVLAGFAFARRQARAAERSAADAPPRPAVEDEGDGSLGRGSSTSLVELR